MPLHNLLYVAGIIFFAYFYNRHHLQSEMSRRTCGSTADPFRHPAGQAHRGVHRHDPGQITLAGAVYLSLIAILPQFLLNGFRGGAHSAHRGMAGCRAAAIRDQG